MCDNQVTFFVPRGYGHREVEIKCGDTDPWGDRTICRHCRTDRNRMGEIRRHEENVKADNAWARSAGWGEF